MAVNIGSNSIADAKVGNDTLVAMYVGTTKIWPETTPPPPTPETVQFTVINNNDESSIDVYKNNVLIDTIAYESSLNITAEIDNDVIVLSANNEFIVNKNGVWFAESVNNTCRIWLSLLDDNDILTVIKKEPMPTKELLLINDTADNITVMLGTETLFVIEPNETVVNTFNNTDILTFITDGISEIVIYVQGVPKTLPGYNVQLDLDDSSIIDHTQIEIRN